MKHAYLIIAHNNFYVLDTLLRLIDDARNDIYLHIDAKCKSFDSDKYKRMVKCSDIFFVDRHDVLWGDYSLIEAELELFSSAHQRGGYSYYHLVSGADLPIKTQNYIHDFFNKNYGCEFITCATKEHTKKFDIVARFNTFRNTKNYIYRLFNRVNLRRYKDDFEVSFGSEWVSVTDEFVKCLLEHKKWIRKHFRYSYTCDEVYKQCIVLNTKFKTRLYAKPNNNNTISFNMRLIDWTNGGAHPKTFTMRDIDEILKSDCLFARKFDESVDKNVVDYIYEKITVG